jgi:hypothetical protein
MSKENELGHNLIDITEEFATKFDLSYNRIDNDEIYLLLHGNKAEYNLTVMLKPEYDVAYFSCDLDIETSSKKYLSATEAVVKANERIWIGHFDIVSDVNRIVYTMTIPFISSFLADEMIIESTIGMIIGECDRFYYYFLVTVSRSKIPGLSIDSLLLESAGEA